MQSWKKYSGQVKKLDILHPCPQYSVEKPFFLVKFNIGRGEE